MITSIHDDSLAERHLGCRRRRSGTSGAADSALGSTLSLVARSCVVAFASWALVACATPTKVAIESKRSVKRIETIAGRSASCRAPKTSSFKKTLVKSGRLAIDAGTATSPASHSRRKDSNWPSSKKKCSDSRSSGVAPLTTEYGDFRSVGEYVAPLTENQAQADRALAQGGGAAQSSKRGMWHRQGQEYVHINAVQPNGILLGVTRYRFDDERRLLSASFARRAEYRDSHWMLRNVQTTLLHEDRSEVVNQSEERWEIELNPELLGTVVMEPEALSVTGLWQYIHYLGEQGLNNARYWLAFWTKVLQPLVTGALVLMAISFIFGPLRSVTLGQRVFTGVLVGFIFRIAQDLLGPSSLVFGFSPLLAVLVPAGICALAGVWLLRRAG